MSAGKIFVWAAFVIATALLVPPSLILFAPDAVAAASGDASLSVTDPAVRQWGYIAAAIAAGLGALGAGYAVAMVGSSAVGALVEKPELLGRLLIIVGLAEGIAIYGLIVAILILNQVS